MAILNLTQRSRVFVEFLVVQPDILRNQYIFSTDPVNPTNPTTRIATMGVAQPATDEEKLILVIDDAIDLSGFGIITAYDSLAGITLTPNTAAIVHGSLTRGQSNVPVAYHLTNSSGTTTIQNRTANVRAEVTFAPAASVSKEIVLDFYPISAGTLPTSFPGDFKNTVYIDINNNRRWIYVEDRTDPNNSSMLAIPNYNENPDGTPITVLPDPVRYYTANSLAITTNSDIEGISFEHNFDGVDTDTIIQLWRLESPGNELFTSYISNIYAPAVATPIEYKQQHKIIPYQSSEGFARPSEAKLEDYYDIIASVDPDAIDWRFTYVPYDISTLSILMPTGIHAGSVKGVVPIDIFNMTFSGDLTNGNVDALLSHTKIFGNTSNVEFYQPHLTTESKSEKVYIIEFDYGLLDGERDYKVNIYAFRDNINDYVLLQSNDINDTVPLLTTAYDYRDRLVSRCRIVRTNLSGVDSADDLIVSLNGESLRDGRVIYLDTANNIAILPRTTNAPGDNFDQMQTGWVKIDTSILADTLVLDESTTTALVTNGNTLVQENLTDSDHDPFFHVIGFENNSEYIVEYYDDPDSYEILPTPEVLPRLINTQVGPGLHRDTHLSIHTGVAPNELSDLYTVGANLYPDPTISPLLRMHHYRKSGRLYYPVVDRNNDIINVGYIHIGEDLHTFLTDGSNEFDFGEELLKLNAIDNTTELDSSFDNPFFTKSQIGSGVFGDAPEGEISFRDILLNTGGGSEGFTMLGTNTPVSGGVRIASVEDFYLPVVPFEDIVITYQQQLLQEDISRPTLPFNNRPFTLPPHKHLFWDTSSKLAFAPLQYNSNEHQATVAMQLTSPALIQAFDNQEWDALLTCGIPDGGVLDQASVFTELPHLINEARSEKVFIFVFHAPESGLPQCKVVAWNDGANDFVTLDSAVISECDVYEYQEDFYNIDNALKYSTFTSLPVAPVTIHDFPEDVFDTLHRNTGEALFYFPFYSLSNTRVKDKPSRVVKLRMGLSDPNFTAIRDGIYPIVYVSSKDDPNNDHSIPKKNAAVFTSNSTGDITVWGYNGVNNRFMRGNTYGDSSVTHISMLDNLSPVDKDIIVVSHSGPIDNIYRKSDFPNNNPITAYWDSTLQLLYLPVITASGGLRDVIELYIENTDIVNDLNNPVDIATNGFVLKNEFYEDINTYSTLPRSKWEVYISTTPNRFTTITNTTIRTSIDDSWYPKIGFSSLLGATGGSSEYLDISYKLDAPETGDTELEKSTMYLEPVLGTSYAKVFMVGNEGLERRGMMNTIILDEKIAAARNCHFDIISVRNTQEQIGIKSTFKRNTLVYVLTADGDISVTSDSDAMYFWDNEAQTYTKFYEGENGGEPIWGNISNQPSSTGPEIDVMVGSVHVHPNKPILDDISESETWLSYNGIRLNKRPIIKEQEW